MFPYATFFNKRIVALNLNILGFKVHEKILEIIWNNWQQLKKTVIVRIQAQSHPDVGLTKSANTSVESIWLCEDLLICLSSTRIYPK